MVTAVLNDDLRQRAWDAAAAVVDPEIPVLTIADLGVLRDVSRSTAAASRSRSRRPIPDYHYRP
jgi:metal-sulfur cluster biosynthetic enzyme